MAIETHIPALKSTFGSRHIQCRDEGLVRRTETTTGISNRRGLVRQVVKELKIQTVDCKATQKFSNSRKLLPPLGRRAVGASNVITAQMLMYTGRN